MTPVLDAEAARRDASAAASDLRQHRASEPYKRAVAWLDALIAQNQAHMTNCAPDKLADQQTRLKQLIALRDALAAPGGATTGFVF